MTGALGKAASSQLITRFFFEEQITSSRFIVTASLFFSEWLTSWFFVAALAQICSVKLRTSPKSPQTPVAQRSYKFFLLLNLFPTSSFPIPSLAFGELVIRISRLLEGLDLLPPSRRTRLCYLYLGEEIIRPSLFWLE